MENRPSTQMQQIDFNDINILGNLISLSGEAVAFSDYNWVVRYCNDVYLKNIGLTRDDVIGKTPFEFIKGFERSIFFKALDEFSRDRKPISKLGFSTILNRWLMVRIFPLENGALMMANDATDAVVLEHQLATQATIDPLTGLPNKLRLMIRIEDLIKADQRFGIMNLGLDKFRGINESLGYAGGDKGLMEIASIFQSITLPDEELFRLNSDEFIVLKENGFENAGERFNQFKQSIKAPITLNGKNFIIGVSSGSCICPDDGSDPELLIKRAGLALRRAKQQKEQRGLLHAYVKSMEEELCHRVQLEEDLREAVRTKAFHLVFQPKGDFKSGDTIGAEALIRWNHPTRGFLPPDAFLKVALGCGLMPAIDVFVLNKALDTTCHWRSLGIKSPVSINVSMESLSNRSLVEHVKQALARTGANPDMLEIEIPEGALMENIEMSLVVLADLREMGVRLSVDDFGTGYSSFAYLTKLPLDTLKIDKSFIRGMESVKANINIIKGIIKMAHSLQLEVVAEGAETQAEMDSLKKMNCDTVQGFFYAKPMSSADFIEFSMKKKMTKSTMSAMSI